MSAGGTSWATAVPITIGQTVGPTAALDYPQGTEQPYFAAWWKFTATYDGTVTLDGSATTGTDPDTDLAVWSGTEGSPTLLAFDGNSGAGNTSLATFAVEAGAEYHIAFGSHWDDATGTENYVLASSWATTAGTWQDDSLETWTQTAALPRSDATASRAALSIHNLAGNSEAVWAQIHADIWNGVGTVTELTGGGGTSPELYGQRDPTTTEANWYVDWRTITRATTGSLTEGTLPETVYTGGAFVDPDVIGVEWETDTTPTAQRLTVTISGNLGETAVAAGETAYIKLGQANPAASPYDPGFETAATVAARDTLGTITIPATGTPEATITSLPIGLTGAATLAVTVIDQYTETQTPLPFPPGTPTQFARRRHPFNLVLEAAFTPRYRLIYSGTPPVTATHAPPLRQYPRNDGLAGSARRLYPPPRSRQRSNRRAGGYL